MVTQVRDKSFYPTNIIQQEYDNRWEIILGRDSETVLTEQELPPGHCCCGKSKNMPFCDGSHGL